MELMVLFIHWKLIHVWKLDFCSRLNLYRKHTGPVKPTPAGHDRLLAELYRSISYRFGAWLGWYSWYIGMFAPAILGSFFGSKRTLILILIREIWFIFGGSGNYTAFAHPSFFSTFYGGSMLKRR